MSVNQDPKNISCNSENVSELIEILRMKTVLYYCLKMKAKMKVRTKMRTGMKMRMNVETVINQG